MEKSLQEIYFQFLEKKIIVGEDILEIHSRHREDGNLAEDINKLNSFITQNGLAIIKTLDDDTGLSYYMLSNMGRDPDDCWKNLLTGNTKWSEQEKDNLHNIYTRLTIIICSCREFTSVCNIICSCREYTSDTNIIGSCREFTSVSNIICSCCEFTSVSNISCSCDEYSRYEQIE